MDDFDQRFDDAVDKIMAEIIKKGNVVGPMVLVYKVKPALKAAYKALKFASMPLTGTYDESHTDVIKLLETMKNDEIKCKKALAEIEKLLDGEG